MTFDRDSLAAKLKRLAGRNVFLGTSSWKYPGWLGTLYERERYVWRGRFSNARFERDCLSEYAQVFPTVSVDAAYYRFPDPRFVEGLVSQVPAHFQFALKVTDEITVRRFPNLPRFGARAGQSNDHFLDAELFTRAFLTPCETMRANLGLLMFEFSHFWPADFSRGRDFLAALDAFLAKLPRGWPYAVELRNRQWLQPEYFATLARHGVTHVFNAWADMPEVGEQMSLSGSETNPAVLAARFLLREGHSYEEAVKLFNPYAELKEPNAAGRQAAAALVRRGLASQGKSRVLIFVNNRFEGNAPGTICAVLDELGGELP